MSDTTEETEQTTGDAGIELSIRFPLVLGPDDRNPGGIVVKGWATDTGEALFTKRLRMDEMTDDMPAGLVTQKLDRPVSCILTCAYDGDDGEILTVAAIRPVLPGEEEETLPPAFVGATIAQANADPDQPCALCDESVPDGADIDRTKVHRECMLANVIGPLGHHLDHGFWCENMGDGYCGRGARQANLDLAALVDKHGLDAVMLGNFPKDDAAVGSGDDA